MKGLVDYLRGLLGGTVQVGRAGPEACEGWLVGVAGDYLTLRAADGSDLHMPLHHIHTITPLPSAGPPPAGSPGPAPPDTFLELLEACLGKWLRLYHAGPEMGVGILRECTAEYLLLEAPTGELVCYTLFHLRSLYLPGEGPYSLPSASHAETGWGR